MIGNNGPLVLYLPYTKGSRAYSNFENFVYTLAPPRKKKEEEKSQPNNPLKQKGGTLNVSPSDQITCTNKKVAVYASTFSASFTFFFSPPSLSSASFFVFFLAVIAPFAIASAGNGR